MAASRIGHEVLAAYFSVAPDGEGMDDLVSTLRRAAFTHSAGLTHSAGYDGEAAAAAAAAPLSPLAPPPPLPPPVAPASAGVGDFGGHVPLVRTVRGGQAWTIAATRAEDDDHSSHAARSGGGTVASDPASQPSMGGSAPAPREPLATPARARGGGGVPPVSATLPRVAALIGASPKPAPPPSSGARLGAVSNRKRITLALETVCLAGAHSARELLAALDAMRAHPAAEHFLILLASPESHSYRGLYAVLPTDGGGDDGGAPAPPPPARLVRVHGHGPEDLTPALAQAADDAVQQQRGRLRVTGTYKYATSQRGFASLASVHPGLTTDALTVRVR